MRAPELTEEQVLTGMDELFQERAAIREYDGGQMREEAEAAAREEMHVCEVRDCIKRYWPNGQRLADYLELVEKKRGKEPADRLRADCREAWRAKQKGQA